MPDSGLKETIFRLTKLKCYWIIHVDVKMHIHSMLLGCASYVGHSHRVQSDSVKGSEHHLLYMDDFACQMLHQDKNIISQRSI